LHVCLCIVGARSILRTVMNQEERLVRLTIVGQTATRRPEFGEELAQFSLTTSRRSVDKGVEHLSIGRLSKSTIVHNEALDLLCDLLLSQIKADHCLDLLQSRHESCIVDNKV